MTSKWYRVLFCLLLAFMVGHIVCCPTNFELLVSNNPQNSTSYEVSRQPRFKRSGFLFMDHENLIVKPANSYFESNVPDGSCTINHKTSRRSQNHNSMNSTKVIESSLTCSRLNKNNYQQVLKDLNNEDSALIQQIHITNSESVNVFLARDLICSKFDCSKMTVFNISGQDINDLSNLVDWLSTFSHLETLDLSNTNTMAIESMFNSKSNAVLQNLFILILDHNYIRSLNFDYIMDKMPNLNQLSLINNTLHNIDCSENLRDQVKTQFEFINLAGNAINCDKSHLWIMKQFPNMSANLKFPDHDQIRCISQEHLLEMTWAQRVSVLETKICDECECRASNKNAITVDCHNKSLKALPDVLPVITKRLILSNNQIDSLKLPPGARNWENVTYMILENNLISSFQPLEINFKYMKNLLALDVRRNKLKEFPSQVFDRFRNLDQVHLSNNPWFCDCESTVAFQEWIQRHFEKVKDKENIICGISGSDVNGVKSYNLQQRLSAGVIYRLDRSELCPQDNLQESYEWLDFVNIILGVTIILILSKVAIDYVYQYRTKRLPHFFRLNY